MTPGYTMVYFDPFVLAIVFAVISLILAILKRKRAAIVFAVIAAFWTLLIIMRFAMSKA